MQRSCIDPYQGLHAGESLLPRIEHTEDKEIHHARDTHHRSR